MGPPLSSEGFASSTFTEQSPLIVHKPLQLEVQASVENGPSPTAPALHLDGSVARPAVAATATIGFLGSISIAVNSLTGPAMVNLPAVYQRSGLIPTTATLVFVCILSSLCSLHMANTISKVPGNARFKKEIEFSQAFYMFWGHKWFVFTQVMFFLCVTCINVSSIVDTAQVVDTFIGHCAGSVALQLRDGMHVHVVQWDPSHCTTEELYSGVCVPFATHSGLLLTIGYVITIAMFLPLALMDLKDNAAWQVVGFVVLIVTTIQFGIEFLYSGIDLDNISLWGDSWYDLLGVVLFNFSLVIAIPAWLSEKDPSVDVPTVVWSSSSLSTLLYVLCGVLGALAMPSVSENMLESILSGAFGTCMQFGASIFAFMIIGLGIPLYSVVTRMNLTGSGLCSHAVGNALAVYLPFSVSWMLYQGHAVTELLAWGGVLFTSVVATILPVLLALHTVLEFDVQGAIAVYGGWFESSDSQRNALIVLLGLAVVSVVCAIVGLIFEGWTSS